MSRHLAKPERITKALARLERLQQRNTAQRERLVKAAEGMDAHATKIADQHRAAALAGDPAAEQTYLRAVRGRAHARRAQS